MGPLEVDYTVSWPLDSYSKQATFSKAGNHHIDIDVPSAVAATGGSFTVTFTNIKDVNGCSARAIDQTISYDVKTTRVSFRRSAEIHRAESASANGKIRRCGNSSGFSGR